MKQLKDHTTSLFFCIASFLCLKCFASAKVSWNLMSPPGVFGSTIYLLCNITDDASSCHNSIRQWLGGPIYGPLCIEKGCGNDPKYGVMEETNLCLYILMIHNFSIFDVECDYTCSYGISNMRKSLTLNSEHFIYIPSEEEKISHFSVLNTVAFFSLFIRKIYPSPKCFASYQGENLSKTMEVHTTTIGLLYSTKIHVIIPLHPFSGNLVIECILGNRKINVTEKKINGCKVDVEWHLMSRPVIFGKPILFVCTIDDKNQNCSQSLRQWLGGPTYRSLCTEAICSNSLKYEVINQLPCSYTLKVHNFSESDVNCDYTCLYGVYHNRKTLILNEDDYMYFPSSEEKHVHILSSMNNISILATIDKIFPQPNCLTTITNEDSNTTEKIHTKSTQNGLFYRTVIFGNYVVLPCNILFTYCVLVDSTIHISTYKQNCRDRHNSVSLMTVLLPTVLCLLGIGVIAFVTWKFARRKKANRWLHLYKQPDEIEGLASINA